MQFKGRTVDAEAPFLSAGFWKEGTEVRGVISKLFQTDNGPAVVLEMEEPVEVDGEEWDRVSVGNMSGFKMALEAGKIPPLRLKDVLTLRCEGFKKSKKEGYSDRVNFELTVDRAS